MLRATASLEQVPDVVVEHYKVGMLSNYKELRPMTARLDSERGTMSRFVGLVRALAAAPTLLLLTGLGTVGAGPSESTMAHPGVNPLFRPLLAKLAGVAVPVLLPTYIARQTAKGLPLYASVDDLGRYSYLIDLGYAPDCRGGGACRLGTVTGGPEVDTPTIFDYPHGQHVRLRNGALALYFPYTCDASCGDSVLVFKIQGVVYTVSVKAGTLAEVRSMAESFAPALAP